MKFPITVTAEYRGLARKAGEFQSDDGETIAYGESLKFEFEDAEGVVQDFTLAVKKLDQVAEFDVTKLERGEFVTITGNVGAGDRGLYLQPVSVSKAAKRVTAAA